MGESRIEEWNKEDELGNIWDPYDELQEISQDKKS